MFCQKSIKNPSESPYLDWIKCGYKKYEGRLECKKSEWELHTGKRIKLFDENDPESWVFAEITSLETYPDFGDAFDKLGSELIPGHTRDQVVKLYNGLFHYHDEDIEILNKNSLPSKMIIDNRVVAIGLKVISMRPCI